VAENRRRAAARFGLPAGGVAWMNQVHGDAVAVVDRADADVPPSVDALVTTRRGLALGVLVADCTPVLLADPRAGVVAAVHAGRAGLVRGVVPAAVARMGALGARPEDIIAVSGPAACGRCYEVPAALRDEVAAVAPAARSTTAAGTPGLDVAAGVGEQLRRVGVTSWHPSPVCTITSTGHFSYRRSARTGRFAGYVWLEHER
jgi:polyphenol oxidase